MVVLGILCQPREIDYYVRAGVLYKGNIYRLWEVAKTNMTDSLDEKLIQLLEKDARQSSEVLAKQLNVSPATVRRRIKRLIQSGVLRMMALVDPDKVGFPLIAVIAFDVAHDRLEAAMQTLADLPEVTWVSTTTGRFDILALVRFRSTEELSTFVQKELPNMEGLRDSETFICLQVKKGRYMPI